MPSSVTAATVANAAAHEASPTGGNFKKLDFYLAKTRLPFIRSGMCMIHFLVLSNGNLIWEIP